LFLKSKHEYHTNPHLFLTIQEDNHTSRSALSSEVCDDSYPDQPTHLTSDEALYDTFPFNDDLFETHPTQDQPVSNEILSMDGSCGEACLESHSTIHVISHDHSEGNERRDSRDDINSCDEFPHERSLEPSYLKLNENFEFGDDYGHTMIINDQFFPNSIISETNKQFQSQNHGLSQDSYSYNGKIDYDLFHPIYDRFLFDNDTNEILAKLMRILLILLILPMSPSMRIFMKSIKVPILKELIQTHYFSYKR
jgi:hypothetical protein